MRQYPRMLSKGKEQNLVVNNESEEYKAGLDGWESHWNPEINKSRKGTDKEVLRVDPNEIVKKEPVKEIKKEEPVKEEEVKKVKASKKDD